VIQAARQTDLLGQLAATFKEATRAPHWRIKRAFDLELLTSQRRTEAALWELKIIRRLVPSSIPVVVLKGCAYAAAGDANAKGRLFSDIDLLIPAEHLGAVESALISGGWKPSAVSAYDQHYYRAWMHELPPMEHVRRHTVVDLHHAIMPTISRYAFDPTPLFNGAVEITTGIYVLNPADRIIHSCLHAFLEGVPSKALRDLYDISRLIGQHFSEPKLFEQLLTRADQLGVRSLINDACHASSSLFPRNFTILNGLTQKTIRSGFLAGAARSATDNAPSHWVMAQWLLAHSHWMKMPIHILLPHLLRKAWIGISERQSDN
jgi:hypothetical protein